MCRSRSVARTARGVQEGHEHGGHDSRVGAGAEDGAQIRAFRCALQILSDLTGFGLGYFDFGGAGYVKTATKVSADNSAFMCNIRKHERTLEVAIAVIGRAVMAASRSLGVRLPDEGKARVTFDDNIITDTSAAKRRDMSEVASGLMNAWEHRTKWYGEDEPTARLLAGAPWAAPASASWDE